MQPAEKFHYTLEANVCEKLLTVCRYNDLAVYIYFVSAWSIVISKYTGARHVAIAMPAFSEGSHFAGDDIRLLPVVININEGQPFKDHLLHVQQAVIDARNNQHYPLDTVYSDLHIDSLYDLCDAVFFCNSLNRKVIADQINLPIVAELQIDKDKITIEVSCSIIAGFSMDQFLGHLFQFMFNTATGALHVAIKDIGLIDEGPEKEKLLHWCNHNNAIKTSAEFSVLNYLFNRIGVVPNAVAIMTGAGPINYAELLSRINQLSYYLQCELGLTKGDRVVVLGERSEWTPVCTIALWKSGLVYVPIDSIYPEERIRFILEDTRPALVITNAALVELVTETGVRTLIVNELFEFSTLAAEKSEIVSVADDDHAYIIYTSGSTGTPKGVIATHGNLNHFFQHVHGQYAGADHVVMPFIASTSFDISLFQMITPLLLGGTSIIVDKSQLQDIDQLIPVLQKSTVIDGVPGLFRLIVNHISEYDLSVHFAHIHKVFIGGDHIADDLLYKLSQAFPCAVITVTYGPTEGAIFCTHLEYAPGSIKEATRGTLIGNPIKGAAIYILGNKNELLPVGVDGEICIAGEGVTKGYLNQIALSVTKFIVNPFDQQAFIYRTGDIGCWTSDGVIAFRGRMDSQVKINGHRIEPGEIEAVLHELSIISHSVVVCRQQNNGIKQLVAYIVVEGAYNREHIMQHLRNRLPEYMIPSVLVNMNALPMTANGKVNKKALPDPDMAGLHDSQYEAPRTEIEKTLAGIWQDLLGVERIGIRDNFFELGGDSIVTIQVVSRARRFGYTLQARDLFIHQTIERLCSALAADRNVLSEVKAEQGRLSGVCGLLPVQRAFFELDSPQVSHFNQSVLLELEKHISYGTLQKAVKHLLHHHDALRFRYKRVANRQWEQYYGNYEGKPVVEDLRNVNKEELPLKITECCNNHLRRLDLEQGELVRMVLMQTPLCEECNRLMIVIHHLVVDGVSWRILLEDLEVLLKHDWQQEGDTAILGLKTSSYRQWYWQLESYRRSGRLASQVSWWNQVAEQYQPLPSDHGYAGRLMMRDIHYHRVRLDALYTDRLLHEASKAYHTEINDILLCALAMSIGQWMNNTKVVVAMEGHGREDLTKQIDLSRTVGWFTSVYPVLLNLGDKKDLRDILRSVKEQLRKIPDKGLGYGVLKYINEEQKPALSRIPDITFNYLGQLDNATGSGNYFRIAPEDSGQSITDYFHVSEKLSVNAAVQGGELIVNWGYSSLHYNKQTIEHLAESYIMHLSMLIEHCMEQQLTVTVCTPSDFGLGNEISYEELDAFMDHHVNGTRRRESIESMYRLSGLQEGMLFHALYGGSYTSQFWCRLMNLNAGLFVRSWGHLMKQHAVLRTGFYYDAFHIPVQCVFKKVKLPLEEIDFREMTPQQQVQAMESYEEYDQLRGFDFNTAPLMRIALFRLSDTEYRMLWTHHHILLDGWSLPVLMKQLLDAYEKLASQQEPVIQQEDKYEDYIRYLDRTDKEQQEQYWRQYLHELNDNTLLPFISRTTERNKGIGDYGKEQTTLNGKTTSDVLRYARDHHVTVNTIMQGVWAWLLYRYTGNQHVAYGISVSGRPDDLPDVEQRVGLYTNTIALHATLQPEDPIGQWLAGLQHDQLLSREYQYSSISDIQSWSGIEGDWFDTLMVFENYPVNKTISSPEWALQLTDVQVRDQVNYPLEITISVAEQIGIVFSYNKDLLETYYVKKIMDHFIRVLDQIINSQHDLQIKQLKLMGEEELDELLTQFNDTTVPFPSQKTIVELLEDQAGRTPQNTALAFDGKLITYEELHKRSNQLAHYLRSKAVNCEALVGICLDRSIEMLISILGIWKAGGAYVPIDPHNPAQRIAYLLEDTECKLLITHSTNRSKIALIEGVQSLEIDSHWERITAYDDQRPGNYPQSHNLAYVIYTSGSTGKPKGVMIEHKGMLNHLYAKINDLKIDEHSKIAQTASVTFDISVWQMFAALLCGGTTYIYSDEVMAAPLQLLKHFEADAITIAELVPSYLSSLLDQDHIAHLPKLNYLVVTGEPVGVAVLNKWINRYPGNTIVNAYGPTEASDDICHYFLKTTLGLSTVPVGRPIQNMRIYILDAQGNICPVGVPGEICVSGPGVGRGYWKDIEKTQQRFGIDIFRDVNDRLYRTGDTGRWLANGNIEYLGRTDDQVKIRGYRIELAEIEKVLEETPLVSRCVVLAKLDGDDNKRLIGYVVATGNFDREAVMNYLRSRLPEYMVPQHWVQLDQIPLTANGKIDKKALTGSGVHLTAGIEFIAPSTELECRLAQFWQELLMVNSIGVNDNIFDLGAHSLTLIRFIGMVKKTFFLELPVRAVFEFNTISLLSKYLDSQLSDERKEHDSNAFELIEL